MHLEPVVWAVADNREVQVRLGRRIACPLAADKRHCQGAQVSQAPGQSLRDTGSGRWLESHLLTSMRSQPTAVRGRLSQRCHRTVTALAYHKQAMQHRRPHRRRTGIRPYGGAV